MKKKSEQLNLPPMTLGMKLLQAREAAGLSIDEAANILRMRPVLLRGMESDDLTGFSHPSYARLSLLDYTRFLRIPVEEIRDWLPDTGGSSMDDYHYLDHYSDPIPAARRQDMLEKVPKNPLVVIFRIVLVIFILGLLVSAYALYRNVARIGPTSEVVTPEISDPTSSPAETGHPESAAEHSSAPDGLWKQGSPLEGGPIRLADPDSAGTEPGVFVGTEEDIRWIAEPPAESLDSESVLELVPGESPGPGITPSSESPEPDAANEQERPRVLPATLP
jgi:cytoskeletal protein RodZ